MGFNTGGYGVTIEDYRAEIERLRESNGELLKERNRLLDEREGIIAFMHAIPAHEAFTATNVFEIYQGWRDSGILSSLIKKFKGC